MSQIRYKNTKPEVKLRKALYSKGIRGYRLHANLTGKPDLAFSHKKIAIFVDGDFWHGNNFKLLWNRIKNKPYWRRKIKGNMARDRKYNKLLKKEGWKVIRVWESQVNKNIEKCIKKISQEL